MSTDRAVVLRGPISNNGEIFEMSMPAMKTEATAASPRPRLLRPKS